MTQLPPELKGKEYFIDPIWIENIVEDNPEALAVFLASDVLLVLAAKDNEIERLKQSLRDIHIQFGRCEKAWRDVSKTNDAILVGEINKLIAENKKLEEEVKMLRGRK